MPSQPRGILPTCLCKHISHHSQQWTHHYIGYWRFFKSLVIFTPTIILRAKASMTPLNPRVCIEGCMSAHVCVLIWSSSLLLCTPRCISWANSTWRWAPLNDLHATKTSGTKCWKSLDRRTYCGMSLACKFYSKALNCLAWWRHGGCPRNHPL